MVKNINQKASKRDFTKVSDEDSFNLSQIIDYSTKRKDTNEKIVKKKTKEDDDSFNLSEIMDDLDKIPDS